MRPVLAKDILEIVQLPSGGDGAWSYPLDRHLAVCPNGRAGRG